MTPFKGQANKPLSGYCIWVVDPSCANKRSFNIRMKKDYAEHAQRTHGNDETYDTDQTLSPPLYEQDLIKLGAKVIYSAEPSDELVNDSFVRIIGLIPSGVDPLNSGDEWIRLVRVLHEYQAILMTPSCIREACSENCQAVLDSLDSFPPRRQNQASAADKSNAPEFLETNLFIIFQSLALDGLVVCSTGFSKTQTMELQAKSLSMGAKFDFNLSSHVTHLIAEQSGSAKFRYASTHQMDIVTAAWLDACVKHRVHIPENAFCTLPFAGFGICTVNMPVRNRNRVQNVIYKLGGLVLDSIDDVGLTHVLLPEGSTSHLASMAKKDVYYVFDKWVFACESENSLVNEQDYDLFGDMALTKREYQPRIEKNESKDKEGQPHFDLEEDEDMDETLACNIVGAYPPNTTGVTLGSYELHLPPEICLNHEFEFLDRLVLYFLGAEATASKLVSFVKSLRKAGVTRVHSMDCALLTHVVCISTVGIEDKRDEYKSLLNAKARGVPFVKFSWIEDCLHKQTLLNSTTYLLDDQDPLFQKQTLPSPLLNGVSNLGLTVARTFSLGGNNLTSSLMLPPSDATKLPSVFRGFRFNLGPLAVTQQNEPVGVISSEIKAAGGKILAHSEHGVSRSGIPTHVVCPVVFDREKFDTTAAGSVRMSSLLQIAANGGLLNPEDQDLMNTSSNQTIDLSQQFTQNSLVPNYVTPAWVRSCLRHDRLVNIYDSILYSPLPTPSPEFSKLHVSITMSRSDAAVDKQRNSVMRILSVLGAEYSDNMTRNKTTHLLCELKQLGRMEPSEKITRARQWKIPIVDIDWLLDSAKAGHPLPLNDFLEQSQYKSKLATNKKGAKSVQTKNKNNNAVSSVALGGSGAESQLSGMNSPPLEFKGLDTQSFFGKSLPPSQRPLKHLQSPAACAPADPDSIKRIQEARAALQPQSFFGVVIRSLTPKLQTETSVDATPIPSPPMALNLGITGMDVAIQGNTPDKEKLESSGLRDDALARRPSAALPPTGKNSLALIHSKFVSKSLLRRNAGEMPVEFDDESMEEDDEEEDGVGGVKLTQGVVYKDQIPDKPEAIAPTPDEVDKPLVVEIWNRSDDKENISLTPGNTHCGKLDHADDREDPQGSNVEAESGRAAMSPPLKKRRGLRAR